MVTERNRTARSGSTAYQEIWDLPYDDPERLDRAYLAAAYVAKSMPVYLLDGSVVNIDTWPDKTVLMKCANLKEAERYLDLVKRHFTYKKGRRRAWGFKFLYPGGSLKEQK